MSKWLLAIACHLAATPAYACDWQITGVYDADTLYAYVPCLPEPLQRVLVRVVGVDAPEAGSKARCDYERDLAARATALTEALVMRSGRVELEFVGWDRWGGRADAIVKINGVTLADALIRAGLARAYDGGKRLPWCE
ncbi:MAG TPA: thermonuclease family protein [Gemmatimonadales bacterium]